MLYLTELMGGHESEVSDIFADFTILVLLKSNCLFGKLFWTYFGPLPFW